MNRTVGILSAAIVLALVAWFVRGRTMSTAPTRTGSAAPAAVPGTVAVPAVMPSLPQEALVTAIPAEKVYAGILRKHRAATGGKLKPGRGYIARFELEVYYGLREARLLALASPEDCERLARVTSLDASATHDDIVAAAYMLQILAQ